MAYFLLDRANAAGQTHDFSFIIKDECHNSTQYTAFSHQLGIFLHDIASWLNSAVPGH
jgi:uncharacterized membrane protein